jgi:thiol-disulfide isomerase/thioredoxin
MPASLEPRIVRVPELPGGRWINTSDFFTRQRLLGQVVLFDFWDYTCVNCLRTLPYVREWHRRYAELGLTIIGIHSPEFRFAGQEHQVLAAIEDLNIPYPVLLDPEYEAWTRFANRAWPTKYLVDNKGYIRFRREGEGHYRELEEAIQLLLLMRDPDVSLPELMAPVRDTDREGAVCYRTTPELYAGYQGGGLFGSAMGNTEGFVTDGIMLYHLPPREQRGEGQFFLEGFWRAWPESIAFAGQDRGRILLPYRAGGVNAVLSPSGDPVEIMLNMRPTQQEPLVEIRQDGEPLSAHIAGRDIWIDQNGETFLRVDKPRLYEIVRNPEFSAHQLEMIFTAQGLALYSFTFNTCVASAGGYSDTEVYTRS